MDFSDNKHYPHALIFHGAEEIDAQEACKQEIIDALAAWNQRGTHELPGLAQLRVENCPLFSITHDGKAGDYWPESSENDISEILVREFLYRNGICELEEIRAHLFHVKYTLLSMTGEDCLLICPYSTSAGNIAGIVVVTVTDKIQDSFMAKTRSGNR